MYPRTPKTIELSARRSGRLGTDRATFTPNELLSAILRAPVDLLWNGGIGTYVKAVGRDPRRGGRSRQRRRCASTAASCAAAWWARAATSGSPNAAASSTRWRRADLHRRHRQLGRRRLQRPRGEHQDPARRRDGRQRRLTLEQRNELLASMTDEVGELVLDDNRAQTLALAIARRQALPMVNVHGRYLNTLEAEGWLNRSLEFLPTDRQIAERQAGGHGPHHARVRGAAGLHEDRQRRPNGAQRPARRPVPRTRSGALLPDGVAQRVPRPDRSATGCAARSSPRRSATRW